MIVIFRGSDTTSVFGKICDKCEIVRLRFIYALEMIHFEKDDNNFNFFFQFSSFIFQQTPKTSEQVSAS